MLIFPSLIGLATSATIDPSVIAAPTIKKAAEEIRLLFERFVKDPSLLPDRYQKRLSDQGAYRVICDYIAGMTDRFCQQLYHQFR